MSLDGFTSFNAQTSQRNGGSIPLAHAGRLQTSLRSIPSSTDEELSETELMNGLPSYKELRPDYDEDRGRSPSFPSHSSPRFGSAAEDGDLSSLPHLTENAVLEVTKKRYHQDLIYTRCGDVLISINPFKTIHIFGQDAHEQYSLETLAQSDRLDPHVFYVACQAVARRAREKSNQVVLVSGESGAGKTEATKLMLKHILHLSASRQDRIFESIDKVNPLLELFGNAQTVLNGNSSRFAKYMEVKFSPEGTVTGAIIRDYILEKSRVTSPAEGECNFHIFYTFLEDVEWDQHRKDQFLMTGIDPRTHFRIIPAHSWHKNQHRMTPQEQGQVFKMIGISQEEVDNIHTVLAAILHLTNTTFVEEEGTFGAVVVEDETTMNKAAALLSVDPKKLASVLVFDKFQIRGQEMETFKSEAKAEETRDAIAKALYERLFGWLIRRINTALCKDASTEAVIAFLDICGFEDLPDNGLEQLCINLANEHLQMFMNKQVFEKDMQVFRDEGILMEGVDPPSNEHILTLFNTPKTGILALINEDTRLEHVNEAGMVQKMRRFHEESGIFEPSRNGDPKFGIVHFAGSVLYNASDFLERNGDNVNPEVRDVLVSSSNEMISDLMQVTKAPTGSISPTQFNYRASVKRGPFQPASQTNLSASMVQDLKQSLRDRFGDKIPKRGGSKRQSFASQSTVVDYFQKSMEELLQKMRNAKPLFVRCIKPNNQQQSNQFMDQKVAVQLRYNGIKQIAEIRKVCFPVRLPLNEFIKKYCELAPESKKLLDKKEAGMTILDTLRIPDRLYNIGKTMIFMKEQAACMLDQALAELAERRRQEEERKRQEEERKKKEEERKRKEEDEQRRLEEAERRRGAQPFGMDTITEVSTPASSFRESNPHLPSTSNSSDESNTSGQTLGTTLHDSVQKKPTFNKLRDSIGLQVKSDSDQEDGKKEPKEEPQPELESSKQWFWDIFRVVAREQPPVDIHHRTTMKIIKIIVYFLLFVIVLVTGTAQKVSLMLLVSTSSLVKVETPTEADKAAASAYYILLAVAICVPYILTFLTSLFRVAFGSFRNPSIGTWIWVFLTESLHSLGLTLLVFRILPRLDVLHGLLLLCVVGSVPALLKPLSAIDFPEHTHRLFWLLDKMLDFLAMAGQVSVFPVIYYLSYIPAGKEEIYMLDAAGAMLLVSLSWWENFMDGNVFVKLKDGNILKNFALKRRFDLERGRYIPHLVLSVWKIVLTIVLAYLYRDDFDFDYESAFEALAGFQTQWKAITAIVVLTMSSAFCYYLGYIACKLWMQRISFSLPLAITTPCAILVFWLNHQYAFLTEVTSNSAGDIKVDWPQGDVKTHWKTLVAGLAWLLSLWLLTRHIWRPRQSRLAKIEMLFMNPMYCGILTAESLLLNRRRHVLTCRKRAIKTPVNDQNSQDKPVERVQYYMQKRDRQTNSDGVYVNSPSEHDEVYSEINDRDRNVSAQTLDSEDPYRTGSRAREEKRDENTPMIYACATMWHEVRREMVALLKSLHRIDREQWMRKQAQVMSHSQDKDYFEYEAHIFFDDAMTLDDDEEFVPNEYVTMLVDVMEEAVSSVHKKSMIIQPPFKIPTPYGGRLVWEMPGGNLLYVHLKDKAKIRHRKRWSQVMYMYYLLGYRLTRQSEEHIIECLNKGGYSSKSGWAVNRDEVVGTDIFEMMDETMVIKSQNTYVMALDGDTDFQPGAVHILLDRMKKNLKVGAACGRIHPIGSGPMVWYQMFEYAIGHWMQKATEHVLGCVLCSPGCFSLFRGSALMDDNVMRMYTVMPTEPSHYLQYDQGEDRWLCTLLLQQGYRVDYAAAADAWTYAPEGFNEFFNQRRRWMPSTLANVMDLLSDYSNTVAVNSNISMLYIIYQVALMIATIIGPGTVLMMIAGALEVVFKTSLYWSYAAAVVPAIIYVIVCLKCPKNIQLYMAAIMSSFYSFVMMIVFVGTIITAVEESIFHPSVLVIAFLVIIFLIAGLFHPLEMFCLPSGLLYLLCVPSGYLLLVVYSICNLHDVSWGTREAPKKKTKAELEREEEEKKKKEEEKAKKKGFFSSLFFTSYLGELKEILTSATGAKQKPEEDRTVKLLEEINANLQKLSDSKCGTEETKPKEIKEAPDSIHIDIPEIQKRKKDGGKGGKPKKTVRISTDVPMESKPPRNELENPKWVECKGLGSGEVMKLFEDELQFWEIFIAKYLKPLDADKQKEEEVGKQLLELRNSVVFAFSMINLLWIAINFMFQYTTPVTLTIPIDGGVKVDILGLLFVIFLLVILLLQIMGMMAHRWGTLLHLLAFTSVEMPCFNKKLSMAESNEMNFKKALDFCQKMSEEPMPDYAEGDDIEDVGKSLKERLQQSVKNPGIGRQSVMGHLTQIGVSTRPDSRPVDLFLRATRRGRDVDDEEATRFHDMWRSRVQDRDLNQRFGNGYASGRQDGMAPAIPRRQPSGGVRKRINANNLRYTVKDAISRVERDVGIRLAPSRREMPNDSWMDQGASNATVGDGRMLQPGGRMDRAFSRRMQHFNSYATQHEQEYRGGRFGVGYQGPRRDV